ncbi:hypothetical protein P154DRAFT_527013 [Amniculicola lignicola CBS 123094]|uniref:Uncharacterized protein n=1 Tax=Amniculicola lignicola CBS 123094 TaxID=1392246 RepID=A0A6A5W0J5_9PLEO|nr:hypothetical protein P154DRAFT_527013 [Amniculicola lignicola CBS 123094]
MTQAAINGKRKNGLHDWYHDAEGKNAVSPPSPEEIEAYTSLFSASTALPKALNSFKANAKANTLRAQISTYLSSKLFNKTQGLLPNKKDRQHANPYLSWWKYSCEELEWAGPWPDTTYTKISHHILPVFYHHFGCIVPSYGALHVIAKLAQPARPSKEPVRPILDVGSGNGYWTFMLRNLGLEGGMKALNVRAIDNQTSEYRVMWVKDTIIANGTDYLASNDNGKGCVLLLVYPQATGDFTASVLKQFEGDTIVIAGTQNGNGFTGFQGEMVDEWMQRGKKEFDLVLRMPLPSFAGKDEGMFVWKRKAEKVASTVE